MNRINTFIVLAISVFLTILVVYLFVNEQAQHEPEVITALLKVEVYRVDRFSLPEADIYLNQRFIGRTDYKGFFLTDINLIVGESYTLRIEKERDGYVYEPWETNFKVAPERKKRREKKEEPGERLPSLEGEFDVLTELERAERIVALFAANPEAGTLGMDGEMIDRPHLVQAQRLLQLAKRLAAL